MSQISTEAAIVRPSVKPLEEAHSIFALTTIGGMIAGEVGKTIDADAFASFGLAGVSFSAGLEMFALDYRLANAGKISSDSSLPLDAIQTPRYLNSRTVAGVATWGLFTEGLAMMMHASGGFHVGLFGLGLTVGIVTTLRSHLRAIS